MLESYSPEIRFVEDGKYEKINYHLRPKQNYIIRWEISMK